MMKRKHQMKNLIAALLLLCAGNTASAFSSMSVCAANTLCFNQWTGMSYSLSCMVSANAYAGTACSWQVYPGIGVECEGFNAYGMWEVFSFRCI